MNNIISKVFCTSLLCAAITYDFDHSLVHLSNVDPYVRQAAQQYLTSKGFGPYNIPERFRPDFEQKLQDAKDEIHSILAQHYSSYIDTYDITRAVKKALKPFVENLRSVVPDYKLESEFTTALTNYMLSKGLDPDTIPSTAVAEYVNRSAAAMNSLRNIMYRDNRNYVRTFEIEKAIRDNMNVFIARIRNSQQTELNGWWDNFFDTTNITYQQPSDSYYVPSTAPVQAYSSQTSSHDPNKIYRHELEHKVTELANKVLASHNINPDKVPARAVAEYSEKTQKALRRLKDTMTHTNRDYVWIDEAEKIMLQELQSVVDKIKFKGELCVICQDNLTSGQKTGLLSCGHVFHKDCIYQWLGYQKTCPICRAEKVIVEKQEIVP